MADTFAVSRNRLILGLCLPLAILLGYLLAEPTDKGTMAVLLAVVGLLVLPLFLRWYHPLLLFLWNATIGLGFLNTRPQLWIVFSFVAFLVAIVSRAVHPERKFLQVSKVTWSLGSLVLVVLATAALTGGIGLNAFGSDRVGGKGYIYIFGAALGYFALTSQAIPLSRANAYVGLFFLSGLTALVPHLIFYAPSLYFLYRWFPPEMAIDQWVAENALYDTGVRISGVMLGALALNAFLLARYGLAGILNLTRPWRLALFLGAGFASLFGGFRSAALFQVALVGFVFLIEGLWRSRYMVFAVVVGVLLAVGLVSFSDRLPISVQRTISFLPVNVSAEAEMSAQASTAWRLEIWRLTIPEIPKYLFKGKGYTLNPQELASLTDFSRRGDSVAAAAFAGDYHNGALSVLIPFGIFGLGTFIWFLLTGGWLLRQNYRYGLPELRTINALLYALFLTRAVFFFAVFGALYSDLYNFTGLLGLSVALNRGVRRPNEQSEPLT